MNAPGLMRAMNDVIHECEAQGIHVKVFKVNLEEFLLLAVYFGYAGLYSWFRNPVFGGVPIKIIW